MRKEQAGKSAPIGIGFWIMTSLGIGLLVYLLGFAVLVHSSQAYMMCQKLGLSAETLDTIYYPIFWLFE